MKRLLPDPFRARFDARWFLPVLVLLPLLVLVAAGASRPDPDEYPHGEFKDDCSECHGEDAWKPVLPSARQRHAKNGFPLEGAHAAADCRACHKTLDFSQSDRMCASCHEDPHRGELGVECARCHGARSFLDPAAMRRMHQLSNFPLTGAHAALDCEGCHRPAANGHLQFVATRADCQSCHLDLARTVRDPDHTGFPTECSQCHSTLGWDGSRFDHARTSFPLTGAHVTTACASCHGDGVYAGKSAACVSCHQPDYDGASPNHVASGFSTQCATCHGTTTWDGAEFDHARTRFPLTGAHVSTTCASCHGDNVYAGKSLACVSCHRSDYDGARDPNHAASGFPLECNSCHGTATWDGADFNHSATSFPLTGAHTSASCTSCHGDGVYDGKSTACISCHRSDYDGTRDPNHASAGFSTDCTQCHGTSNWDDADFNHSTTNFPLTGAHVSTTCSSCHGDGVFAGKSLTCFSCHGGDYASATPSHAGFPTECASCHGTSVWTGATFNHSATSFPLTGAHTAAACNSCHGDGVYDGKSTACMSCHQSDYNGTRDPNHAAAGFSTDCTTCHGTATWDGGSFNHSTTQFPLTGAHVSTTCSSCHGDNVFAGKSLACVSCHRSDYDGATPNHVTSGFPTECASCHGTSVWAGATFNHSATSFPLTGAHTAAACNSCHGDDVYDGKSTACMSCHQSDYNGTRDPNHAAAGFSTDCTTCHGTATWDGGSFNHSTTQFPLTGAHVSTTCSSCHGDNVFAGKSLACVSCHRSDYDGATPNHVASGFPTECASCHGTSTWAGATFDHDGPWFPIYSGRHRNEWNACSDCHTNPANYSTFTCLSCHPHSDRTKTDDDHRGRSGYAYDSQACYSCHPRGNS